MKGKFIVIDGTDGSGKATQTELLVKYLQDRDVSVRMADFPRYGKPSAMFVEKYLRGEYGSLDELGDSLGARRASLFFALDRFDAAKELRRSLDAGIWVVSNRYVSANMGHQTGKIKDPVERDKFLDWLDDLEYRILGIPRPDKTILLYVSPEVGQELVGKKDKREYTEGKTHDLHEEDIQHLHDAADAYRYVAMKYAWPTILCTGELEGGTMLSREEILALLVKEIEPLLES